MNQDDEVNIILISFIHQKVKYATTDLKTVNYLWKEWPSWLEASAIHRCEEEDAVELLAGVEEEIEEVDGDDEDECLSLLEPVKKANFSWHM